MKQKKDTTRQISVFIASPGDLSPERKIFKETIDQLNIGFADGANVEFSGYGWEDALAETGRRTQGVINKQIDQCDLFILVLHRRWGQPAPDSKFSSYTEEEFNLAFSLWKKKKAPEVLVFFKTVDNASVADPGPELQKVVAFRKELQQTRAIILRTFNTDIDFGKEVDRHLRAFAKDEWKEFDEDSPTVDFPKAQVVALNKAKRKESADLEKKGKASSKSAGKKTKAKTPKADLSLVTLHQTDLTLARAAVDAAEAGRIQDARILFAKATEGTTDLSVLSVAAEFFRQIGDPDNASRLVQRQAAIARDRRIAVQHYFALVPTDYISANQEQFLSHMLAEVPEDVAEDIREIYHEAFGKEKMESMLAEIMVKHYTEAELVQFARFLASPVGQSSLQKYPAMMAEAMEWGKQEFQRVLLQHYPELAGDAPTPSNSAGDAKVLDMPLTQPGQLTIGDSASSKSRASAKTRK
jgi:hypothetical protein